MYRFPSEPHGPQTQIWRKMFDYNSPIRLRVELTCTQLWAACGFTLSVFKYRNNIGNALQFTECDPGTYQSFTACLNFSNTNCLSSTQNSNLCKRIWKMLTFNILMSAAWYFWHEKIKRIFWGGGEGLLLTF